MMSIPSYRACFSLLVVALGGCAEVAPAVDASRDRQAPTEDAAPGTDATVPPVDATVPSVDATVPPVDANGPPVDGSGSARVVINEVRAEGEDWIELVNVGTAPADLGGWGVTDSENDGDARVATTSRFPAGTTLAPAAYLLVVVDQADSGVGPQMRCLADGGPMTCFHGGFGISASRGESVHLVTPSGALAASANYPMNAAPAGETWGRLPNGVGAFARNRPTPGAPNQSP